MTLSKLFLALAAAGLLAGGAQAQQLRADVAKPLQAASQLLRAGKAREALAEVRKADAVGNKTGAEQLTIDRMKAAAAQRAGEMGTAIAALESIHGRVGGAEQGQVAEQIASAYAQSRNNAKANEWLQKAVAAGNNGAGVRQLREYLQSNSGDYTAIAREAGNEVANAEKAGRKPEEGDLLRLADAQQRTGNQAGYLHTLEKLAAHYPKKEYWNAYLGRLPRKSGFADRYALDVMRLRLATGGLTKTEEFMEMAQLALQAGLAAEGKRIVDKGFAAGALGTGPEAERHQRLRKLAEDKLAESKNELPQQAANAAAGKNGNDMLKAGFALASAGQHAEGIKLLDQALTTPGLTRPDEARLRLGQALMVQGSNRARALQVLRSVQGTDGVADIARLWTVLPSPSL